MSIVMLLNIWAFCLVFICSVQTEKHLKLPSYIQPCSKSAPDFEQCSLQHAIEALPYVIKGDREYNIPVLDPLVLPSLEITFGTFKIKGKDLRITGFSNTELKQIKFDLNKNQFTSKLYVDRLSIIGKYESEGKILILPIQGEGNINITVIGLELQYQVNYLLEELDGDEYIIFSADAEADFDIKKFYIDLGNLFAGNKELGDATNKALNDEWDKFLETIKPAISQALVELAQSITRAFTVSIPVKYIFLD